MSDTIKCTIRTPQHKDGKIHYWRVQYGEFNELTFLFTPDSPKKDGDHNVQFHSMEDFKKYRVK